MKNLFKTLSGMLAVLLASSMIVGTALADQETVTVSNDPAVASGEAVNGLAEEEPEEIAEEVATQNDTAATYSGTCGTNVTWALNTETGVMTISGSGTMYYYQSPDDVPWYSYEDSIKTVSIQNGVNSIGDYAFDSCSSLTSITIPSSVTSIGVAAFYGCSSLPSIEIPSSVTSIGRYAFEGCSGLTSIEIPSSVTSIGNCAFQNCSKLTSITIPSSVTSIGTSAFRGCSGLASIVVDEDNTVYDSRDNCNAIIETSTDTLIAGCKNTIIPSSVTCIGDDAFYYCSGLTNIEIPSSVISISNSAFYYCSKLTSIKIPSSITSIDWGAFYGCSSLTDVYYFGSSDDWGNISIDDGNDYLKNAKIHYNSTIASGVVTIGTCGDNLTWTLDSNGILTISGSGDMNNYNCDNVPWYSYEDSIKTVSIQNGVTSIGSFAFNYCSGLTSVEIPSGVTSIGAYAFNNCSGLTSIEIPSGVTSIGDSAFDYCSGLTSITIPSGVTSISDYAFYGCTSLTSIVVDKGNIVYDSRDNCNALIKTSTNELIQGCNNTVIPSGVTSIRSSAFYYCSKLTSITIPSSVTSISDYAFYGCSGLTSITIQEGVTSIGGYAFYRCSGLTRIEIPEGVTSIGEHAFLYCSNLTTIEIPDSVTSIGMGAFDSTGYYNDSANWDGDSLYIGNIFVKANSNITAVEFKEGTRIIVGTAFSGCSSFTSIEIPSSVTSIGDWAFYDCSSLTSIEIPTSVTEIGMGAFGYCSGLTSIEIPDSVTSIGNRVFMGCTSLKSVKLPLGMTSIDFLDFEDCSGLTSITIPSGVTDIVESAFSGCSSLTSIVIPSSVTSISKYAFDGCMNLVIYGEKGSYAETYADDNNITFVPITFGSTIELAPGMSTSVAAAITLPESAANKKILWSSSDTDIAIIDENGVVTVKKYSSSPVTITAVIADSNTLCAMVQFQTCFKDVAGTGTKADATEDKPYQYYFDPVYWAAENNITKGYTSGEYAGCFGVGLDCTRQDFVLFLYRMAGQPSVKASDANVFTDVASSKLSSTFKKAIAWAVSKGITTGYKAKDGTRTFGVGNSIARKDAVIMLYRYAGKPSVTVKKTGFTDVDGVYKTSSDTFKAIAWAKANKITSGLSQAQADEAKLTYPAFGCNMSCVREQMITFIYRLNNCLNK